MASEKYYAYILDTCTRCNICYKSCILFHELGSDFNDILLKNNLKKGVNKCSLCGLCNVVCPVEIDLSYYYQLLKQEKTNPLLKKYFKYKHRKMVKKINV